jgi:DNA (cytosine-5)-methyltransferase 1
MNNQYNFTFIDLFSGIGGFKIALDRNGGKCLGFSEINQDAISAYNNNFDKSNINNFGDITKIKFLPPHDLLTAGVPCQSWSIAGKNLGFDDDRGQLWNDTIYLLEQSKPKVFIFENVKGLVDPRNKEALNYILSRIKQAGYHANYYVLNSHEYGVPQNRVRVYIVGFKEQRFFHKFNLPQSVNKKNKLSDILGIDLADSNDLKDNVQRNLFGEIIPIKTMSLSNKNGFNDYFLFNDLRNGHTTIHSWDIIETTKRQKSICYLLLKNRRKSIYGNLDGNPLSLSHFKALDATILEEELFELINLGIIKIVEYSFSIKTIDNTLLTEEENIFLSYKANNNLIVADLKVNREIKLKRISILKTLESLKNKDIIECNEVRYDFKNTKISTGLFGINRIFLPSSNIISTLVASDTNDYIALKDIKPSNNLDYKEEFIEEIYKKNNYRKITKNEACLIQGFPEEFILPKSRNRWMKLIGNSVSVPVIDTLCKAIIDTGVFKNKKFCNKPLFIDSFHSSRQVSLQT